MRRDEAIEVAVERGDWVVRRGVRTLGAFTCSACAVAFARSIAEAASGWTVRPRIVVDLGRQEEPLG